MVQSVRCSVSCDPEQDMAASGEPAHAVTIQMLRKISLPSLVLFLLISFPVRPEDDTLDWLSSYKAAIEEARRSHKPIFLEYRCEP
jgi:hypothetical protein